MPAQLMTRVGRDGHRIHIRPCVTDAGDWVWDATKDGPIRQVPQPDDSLMNVRYDSWLGDGVSLSLREALESAAATCLLHTTGHLPCRWCQGDGCTTCHQTGVTP